MNFTYYVKTNPDPAFHGEITNPATEARRRHAHGDLARWFNRLFNFSSAPDTLHTRALPVVGAACLSLNLTLTLTLTLTLGLSLSLSLSPTLSLTLSLSLTLILTPNLSLNLTL